jgi:hypothetical protein
VNTGMFILSVIHITLRASHSSKHLPLINSFNSQIDLIIAFLIITILHADEETES